MNIFLNDGLTMRGTAFIFDLKNVKLHCTTT